MRVVQVLAYDDDYERFQWSRLFSTPESAYAWLRSAESNTFADARTFTISWVGVDDPEVSELDTLELRYIIWGSTRKEDTAVFQRWDSKKKKYVEVDFGEEDASI